MTMTESVEQVAEKLGLFARVGLFYRQVVSELRKVVWPTRNQLTTYTAVVLGVRYLHYCRCFSHRLCSYKSCLLGIWIRTDDDRRDQARCI
jgi:preprotein translocase subunit SecE